jgi:hypothetical protein
MKKILFVILSLITYAVSAQEISEERVLEEFTKIHTKGVEDVYLTQGPVNIKIEASNGTLKNLKTEILEGTLSIREDKKSDLKNIKVYISVPNLTHARVSGTGNLISKDTLKFDNFNINVAGAGDVDIIVNTLNLKTTVIGTGDIKLSGRAIVHEADIAGAGDLMAMELLTDVTNARVAGAGDIQVNATEELNVNVSGAGDVFYKDEPKKKEIKISGAGDIFSFAPDTINAPDTTKLKLGNRKFWIIGDEDEFSWSCDTCNQESDPFKHWAGFEIGANGYVSSSGLSLPKGYDFLELNYSKSLNFNLNIIEKRINVYKDKVQILSGLGIEFNHYSFDNDIILSSKTNPISATVDSINNYSKNQLNVAYINVPLMIGFNSGSDKDKSMHISAGIVGGYKIRTKYKTKYEFNNEEFKNKTKANYNISPYRVSARASLGYGNFNIYGTYSLTEFFETNKGPELHSFSIGIRVIPF